MATNKNNIEMTYVIFYPNYADTITTSYIGNKRYYYGSDKGTNFIKQESMTNINSEYENTAPYKILSQSKTLINE
jgi:hypothetical protein